MPRAGWLALGALTAGLASLEGWLPGGIGLAGVAGVALAATAAMAVVRTWRAFALALGVAIGAAPPRGTGCRGGAATGPRSPPHR